jgi:hypothetical protein
VTGAARYSSEGPSVPLPDRNTRVHRISFRHRTSAAPQTDAKKISESDSGVGYAARLATRVVQSASYSERLRHVMDSAWMDDCISSAKIW